MTRTPPTNSLVVKLLDKMIAAMERQPAANHIQSRPAVSLHATPQTSGIDALFAAVPDLQKSQWFDERLRLIDTEDLARDVFRLSGPLKKEFGQISTFLAYWNNLVKQRRHLTK